MEFILEKEADSKEAKEYFKECLAEITGYTMQEFYERGDIVRSYAGTIITLDNWVLVWHLANAKHELYKAD